MPTPGKRLALFPDSVDSEGFPHSTVAVRRAFWGLNGSGLRDEQPVVRRGIVLAESKRGDGVRLWRERQPS